MAAKRLILVTGATGAQGGSVAKALLASGEFSVRAATRKPDSEAARALKAGGAEVVACDMGDVESMRRAVNGCYGVFGVTNFWEHFKGEIEHGRNLVDAVAAGGVEHLVFSGLPSVKKSAPHLNVPHFETKAEVEEGIRSLGLPATFVHVAFYYENFLAFFPPKKEADGTYAFGFPQGETPLGAVTVEDLGGVVLPIFRDRGAFLGQTVAVFGDEMPASGYADAISRVTGRQVRFHHIPREVFASFGFPGAEDVADMFEFYRSHFPSKRPEIERAKKLNPGMRSFEEWARQNRERLIATLDA